MTEDVRQLALNDEEIVMAGGRAEARRDRLAQLELDERNDLDARYAKLRNLLGEQKREERSTLLSRHRAARHEQHREDLEELKVMLRRDVLNMRVRLNRWVAALDITNEAKATRVIELLHGRTLEETYVDYGVDANRFRARTRIEGYLKLVAGNKRLLVKEYARELDAAFSLAKVAPRYAWKPAVVNVVQSDGETRRTVQFRWRRLRPILSNPEEGAEEEG